MHNKGTCYSSLWKGLLFVYAYFTQEKMYLNIHANPFNYNDKQCNAIYKEWFKYI